MCLGLLKKIRLTRKMTDINYQREYLLIELTKIVTIFTSYQIVCGWLAVKEDSERPLYLIQLFVTIFIR